VAALFSTPPQNLKMSIKIATQVIKIIIRNQISIWVHAMDRLKACLYLSPLSQTGTHVILTTGNQLVDPEPGDIPDII
jgi:hypothetical protein